MNIISIDWDYFIQEDLMLDLAHMETNLFVGPIWDIRRLGWLAQGETTEELMPFKGPDAWQFLFKTVRHDSRFHVACAESHAAIVGFLDQCLAASKSVRSKKFTIYNFDAHHDMVYGAPRFEAGEYDCGDWLGWLIATKRVKKVVQIYPEWRVKYLEEMMHVLKFALEHKVPYHYQIGLNRLKPIKADVVFLCRSGAWTPPEYDSKFNLLCNVFGLEVSLPERVINTPSEKQMRDYQEVLKGVQHGI